MTLHQGLRRSAHGANAGGAGGTGGAASQVAAFDARSVERPDPRLWTYYFITALIIVPAAPILLPVLYFRYHTLRYRFDDDGISMSVGILFKREVHLTYRRIQDIHLTRGLIQRWLGLATISLQTAAGSSNAEMQIEGVLEAEALRDWLYARMRGAHLEAPASGARPAGEGGGGSGASPGTIVGTAPPVAAATSASSDEVTALLSEIRDEVKSLRERLGRSA